MKRFAFFLFLLYAILLTPIQIKAQAPRLAECDSCGYCQGKTAPSTWGNCVKCLYPEALDPPNTGNPPDPAEGSTLLINQETADDTYNQQVTPHPGRYYTQIGCLKTELNDFTNPGAAGGITNQLLNSLIFPLVGGIAFLYLIYAAILIATSQRDPGRLSKGKAVGTGALVGLMFTLSSVFIVNLITTGVLKIPGFASGTNDPARIQGRVVQEGQPYFPSTSVPLGTPATITIDTVGNYSVSNHWDQFQPGNDPKFKCGSSYNVSITLQDSVLYKTSYAVCPNKTIPSETTCTFKAGSSARVKIPAAPIKLDDGTSLCYADIYWRVEPR